MAEQAGPPSTPEEAPSSSEAGQSPPLPPLPAEQSQAPASLAPGVAQVGPAPAPAQKRVPWALIAIIVVPVLLVGIAALVLWQTGVLSLLFPQPAVATVVPAGADLFVSINANLESLPGYKHLADIYGDLPEVKEAIDDLNSSLEEQGISFEDDVRPWIGREVGIAVSNLDTAIPFPLTDLGGTEERDEPGIVIVASSRNTRASDAFLVKYQDSLTEQGYTVERQEYAGVAHYRASRSGGSPILFGGVKSFVVLAQGEEAMQGLIDVAQGKADSLAKNEAYAEIRRLLPANAAGYIVLPDLKRLLEPLMATASNLVLGGFTGQSQAYGSAGAALLLEEDGVRIEVASKLDPEAVTPETLAFVQTEASAERILKSIPADALGFYSGQNLSSGWENTLRQLQTVPDSEQVIQQMADALGLAIDEDLFSWAAGEYAFAVVQVDGPSGVGGFMVMEVSDQQKATDVLGKVASAVEEISEAQFQDKEIAGSTVRIISDPWSGEVMGGYGFAREHLFIGIMDQVLEKVVPGDFAAIADDKTFQAVRKHLPARRTSNLYINLSAIWELVAGTLPDESRAVIDSIQAIGVAGPPYDAGSGVARMTLFIYIP